MEEQTTAAVEWVNSGPVKTVLEPLARRMERAPILFWRMGFGPLLGKRVLILSHVGRRSGRIRRTALEYYRHGERIYVISARPRSDWLANILAQPRVTLQTDAGAQRAFARPLRTPADFYAFHGVIERNPLLRGLLESAGEDTSLTGYLAAQRERARSEGQPFTVVTFDPTDAPAPPALETDLRWVAPVIVAAFGVGYLLGGRDRPRAKRRRPWWG